MSNAAPFDQRAALEGAIVSLILPPPRDSRSVASMATVATAYLFGMLGMQVVVPSGGRSIASTSTISMVLAGLCGISLGYVLSAIIQRWAFSRRESVLKAEEKRLGGIDDPRMTLSRIVFELEREAPRWSFSRHTAWRWPSFLAKLDAADMGRPRTLVDDRHMMAVSTIGLPDELLEPETIAKGGGPPGCIVPALALTVLGCLLLGFASGSFVYPALGVVCLVI
ncbi:MAG: hypothetical protein L0Y44_05680 [Phycisphaerales bacterium]|nr:hypothetical protein [Phycisphaerales bacterium]